MEIAQAELAGATFAQGRITAIRDFRYVPYVAREAVFTGAPESPEITG